MDMQKHKTNVRAKHHPPAYYRYRKNHPTVSLVLTKELKNLLDTEKQRDGLSYSDLVRKFIVQQSDVAKVRQEGYAEGYAKATQEEEKKHLGDDVKQYNAGLRAGKASVLKHVALGFCWKCHKPIFWDLTNPENLKKLVTRWLPKDTTTTIAHNMR